MALHLSPPLGPFWMLENSAQKRHLPVHDLLPTEPSFQQGLLSIARSLGPIDLAGTTQQGPSLEKRLGHLATGAANLFPLWLVIGATSALAHPPSLAWFKREYITKGLALTMLSMGTTLTLEASHHLLLSVRSCIAMYGALYPMIRCHSRQDSRERAGVQVSKNTRSFP